jgi:hypothetical protein
VAACVAVGLLLLGLVVGAHAGTPGAVPNPPAATVMTGSTPG